MTKGEIEFLKESNAIGGVYDEDSLEQAKLAWEYIRDQPQLHPSNIKRTHKILMSGKLEKKYVGHYRDCPIFIDGREGASVSSLWIMVKEWALDTKKRGLTQQEITDHHVRYEHIHPFFDGNGRTGRIFMNWQRLKNGFPILILREKDKNMYYKWFC